VLEDAGGESLKTLLAQGPLDLERFFAIVLPLVATIARIHERGVIHKDINPSNVLVNLAEGEVRVIDFSISFGSRRSTGGICSIPICSRVPSPTCRPSRRGA